ncbi:palmitoyltransferase [Rhizophlyctis rosea]|uniref:Palmitoyltransferase n=1 Tax=Rhizophlyctis rosea TaxID=64517 RepID=A0AAD5S9A9_9FUNG|nr:palmitoyltransferase [Rhizophlyctis rosea]
MGITVHAIGILQRGTPPKILAFESDLSTFSYFQRGTRAEFLNFFVKTVTERTQPGQRSKVEEAGSIGYVFVRSDGLAAVIVTEPEYPDRTAFSILNKLLDEFAAKFPADKWSSLNPAITSPQYPELKKHLTVAQDPQSADPFMRVQKELDETKVVLHKTMQSLLDRGEKLDDLITKSEDLSMQSKSFYKTAKKTNSCCVNPSNLVLTSKLFFYTLGKDNHTRALWLRHKHGILSLYRAVLAPESHRVLNADVASILKENGAFINRFLIQRTYHRASQEEISYVLIDHGDTLYGPAVDPPAIVDDFAHFRRHLNIIYHYPGKPEVRNMQRYLMDLVHTYNFIIDFDTKNSEGSHIGILTIFSALIARQDEFALELLYDLFPPSSDPHKIRQRHLDRYITANALAEIQPMSPDFQKSYLEWFHKRNIKFDYGTVENYLSDLDLEDWELDLPDTITFLRRHMDDDTVIPAFFMPMIGPLRDIRPDWLDFYTCLRAGFPDFDQKFAQSLVNDRSDYILNGKNVTKITTVVKFLRPDHEIVTHLLDILFCNNNHTLPAPNDSLALMNFFPKCWGKANIDWDHIILLLKEGMIFKPAYISWVVWRICTGARAGHRCREPACKWHFEAVWEVVQPFLDHVAGTVKDCEDIELVAKWRGHVRVGLPFLKEFQRNLAGRWMREKEIRMRVKGVPRWLNGARRRLQEFRRLLKGIPRWSKRTDPAGRKSRFGTRMWGVKMRMFGIWGGVKRRWRGY